MAITFRRTKSKLRSAAAKARQDTARHIHQATLSAGMAIARDVDARILALPKPLNIIVKPAGTQIIGGDKPGRFAPRELAGTGIIVFTLAIPRRRGPLMTNFLETIRHFADWRMRTALMEEVHSR